MWDDEIVLVGESARNADVVSVQRVANDEGHTRPLYLDQKEQRLIWLSPGGRPLATLSVKGQSRQQAPVAVRPKRVMGGGCPVDPEARGPAKTSGPTDEQQGRRAPRTSAYFALERRGAA